MRIKRSIVIPCYNEGVRIENSVRRVLDYFSKSGESFELIVVNDGSTDQTSSVLSSIHDKRLTVLSEQKNRGKGYAVRKGMLYSRGSTVLFTDADLSMPIGESAKLFSVLEQGFDVAIGSKAHPDSIAVVQPSEIRMLMGRSFNRTVKWLTGLNFSDTQCGFKAFSRDAVMSIFSVAKIDDFSFDVEVLYIAKCMNLRVAEIPVSWEYSEGSKVRVFRDSCKMLINMLMLRRIHKNLGWHTKTAEPDDVMLTLPETVENSKKNKNIKK